MALTEAQRTTLVAHIQANTDQAVIDALAVRNDALLAELYNAASSTYVWRESVAPEEYREAMDWTEIDQLTAGKARIWEWITADMSLPIDASKSNVRAGLAEVYPSNSNTRPAMLAIAKEQCSIFESIYATGTGSESDPAVRVVRGPISVREISEALNAA